MMTPLTCSHGRPIEGPSLRAVLDGAVSCDDCEAEEWTRVRLLTIVGTIALVTLIWSPLVLLLVGVFW